MATVESDPSRRVYRGPVVRLHVVVSGGVGVVRSTEVVDRMTLRAPWQATDRELAGAASFVEAIDADGNVVYRQRIADPGDSSVELFDRGGAIHREDNDGEVHLDVLIPALDGGDLRIVSRGEPLPLRTPRGKAREAYPMPSRDQTAGDD